VIGIIIIFSKTQHSPFVHHYIILTQTSSIIYLDFGEKIQGIRRNYTIGAYFNENVKVLSDYYAFTRQRKDYRFLRYGTMNTHRYYARILYRS
jgi:hypothetical protein